MATHGSLKTSNGSMFCMSCAKPVALSLAKLAWPPAGNETTTLQARVKPFEQGRAMPPEAALAAGGFFDDYLLIGFH